MKNSESEKLFNNLKEEKIVYGIKDPNISIKFMKSHIWSILLLVLILNVKVVTILNATELFFAGIIFLIIVMLTIYLYLKNSYMLYFKSHYIILENKLKERKIIDVKKHPRIYMRYKESEVYHAKSGITRIISYYNIYIQQKNMEIVLDMRRISKEKINSIIQNLELKEKEGITEIEFVESMTKEERNYLDYIKFLNKQEKIIGVKDTDKEIVVFSDVNRDIKPKFVIVIITSIFCIFISSLTNNIRSG